VYSYLYIVISYLNQLDHIRPAGHQLGICIFVMRLVCALLSFTLFCQYEREQTLAVLNLRISLTDYTWNLFHFCKSSLTLLSLAVPHYSLFHIIYYGKKCIK